MLAKALLAHLASAALVVAQDAADAASSLASAPDAADTLSVLAAAPYAADSATPLATAPDAVYTASLPATGANPVSAPDATYSASAAAGMPSPSMAILTQPLLVPIASGGCPTATATGIMCSTCVVPACLRIQTLTLTGCGCPTPVPTTTRDWPCDGGCDGLGCGTSYVVQQQGVGCPGAGNGGVPASTPRGLSGAAPTGWDGMVPTRGGLGPGPMAAAARPVPFRFWM